MLVSSDRGAAAMGGTEPTPLTAAIPLPPGTELVPLAREAIAYDRSGRARPLGKGRLALAALVPGHTRTAFPAYRDDRALPPLEALPYAAVAADQRGELVVAAGNPVRIAAAAERGISPLREHAANALARQLARCSREHACAAARAGLGRGALPVPLGAPPAERPDAPIALRSGYAGSPSELAAFRPTSQEVADVVATHMARGGSGAAFGRACDGEPLSRIRPLEEAIAAIRERSPGAAIHLETCGSDPSALRRAAEAGLGSVTVRLGAALAGSYERLHGPLAHRWADVRASLQVAVEHRLAITVALLVLPGLTDQQLETDAIVALLGELPGGRVELRDLGADPLRALSALPSSRPLGMLTFLGRIAEADHFEMQAAAV